MYIIDFDDTLLDTQKFKKERMKALLSLGVSEEIYWNSYSEARYDDENISTYCDKRHADILHYKYGFVKKEVLAKLDEVNKKMPEILFPEVFNFLEKLKQTGDSLVLLSLGEPSFQEFKVKLSGVDKYFDRLFFVDDTKQHVIGELLEKTEDKHVWFIDNEIKQAVQMNRIYTKLRTVIKANEHVLKVKYDLARLPYFYNLLDIAEYVSH